MMFVQQLHSMGKAELLLLMILICLLPMVGRME